jgi:cytochrome c biogenesis protein CcdA
MYIGAAYALPVLIIGALIDLLAQQVIPNRRLLAIMEIVSLAAIVIINKLP